MAPQIAARSIQPFMPEAAAFPRRLEPRTSFSVICDPMEHLEPDFASVRCVYAQTDCGVTIEGKSPALRQLVDNAKLRHGR